MNILCYDARLKGLPESCIAKQVCNELCQINYCGFINWVTHVRELAQRYGLHNYSRDSTECKDICKSRLRDPSKTTGWLNWIITIETQNHENTLRLKRRLVLNNTPCGVSLEYAITMLRSSSRNHEIKRGRHCRLKIPPQERLCHVCHTLEDEKHHLITCIRGKKDGFFIN